jgi:hypothetical protein
VKGLDLTRPRLKLLLLPSLESQPERQLLRLGKKLLVVRLFQDVYRELLLHLF